LTKKANLAIGVDNKDNIHYVALGRDKVHSSSSYGFKRIGKNYFDDTWFKCNSKSYYKSSEHTFLKILDTDYCGTTLKYRAFMPMELFT